MWAVVPVKRIEESKTRLSPILDDVQRAEFTAAMLHDVLHELEKVETLQGIGLLTNDERMQALARHRGLRVWPAQAESLNRSLEIVGEELSAQGSGMMIVPCDLPTVTARDYHDLLVSHHSGVTLAGAHDGGTNVLVCAAGTSMPFHFGAGSLARHTEAARNLGIPVLVTGSRAFQRDIDRPDDIDWLLQSEHECHARRWLQREQRLDLATNRRRTG